MLCTCLMQPHTRDMFYQQEGASPYTLYLMQPHICAMFYEQEGASPYTLYLMQPHTRAMFYQQEGASPHSQHPRRSCCSVARTTRLQRSTAETWRSISVFEFCVFLAVKVVV